MITEAILNLFLNPLKGLLDSISFGIDIIVIPAEVITGFQTLFSNLCYLFPVVQLLPILFFSIALSSIHLTWVVILRIKSFIPTMGN